MPRHNWFRYLCHLYASLSPHWIWNAHFFSRANAKLISNSFLKQRVSFRCERVWQYATPAWKQPQSSGSVEYKSSAMNTDPVRIPEPLYQVVTLWTHVSKGWTHGTRVTCVAWFPTNGTEAPSSLTNLSLGTWKLTSTKWSARNSPPSWGIRHPMGLNPLHVMWSVWNSPLPWWKLHLQWVWILFHLS